MIEHDSVLVIFQYSVYQLSILQGTHCSSLLLGQGVLQTKATKQTQSEEHHGSWEGRQQKNFD